MAKVLIPVFAILGTVRAGNPKDIGRFVEIQAHTDRDTRVGTYATFFDIKGKRITGRVDRLDDNILLVDTFASPPDPNAQKPTRMQKGGIQTHKV